MEKHTTEQCLDFFHATEYLADVAYAAFPGKTDKTKREAWLNNRCKQLKHELGAVDDIIAEMKLFAKRKKLSKSIQENLLAAQTYFANNRHRMNYADHLAQNLPIGSRDAQL